MRSTNVSQKKFITYWWIEELMAPSATLFKGVSTSFSKKKKVCPNLYIFRQQWRIHVHDRLCKEVYGSRISYLSLLGPLSSADFPTERKFSLPYSSKCFTCRTYPACTRNIMGTSKIKTAWPTYIRYACYLSLAILVRASLVRKRNFIKLMKALLTYRAAYTFLSWSCGLSSHLQISYGNKTHVHYCKCFLPSLSCAWWLLISHWGARQGRV